MLIGNVQKGNDVDINSAIELLQKIAKHTRETDLVVKAFNPGTLGGTPCVRVASIGAGFDWDKGKVIINTEVPMTFLTQEQVDAIMESVSKGQSWHAYQAYKKVADENKALKEEIKRLQSATQ